MREYLRKVVAVFGTTVGIILLVSSSSHAELESPGKPIPIGNALLKQQTIERIIRSIITEVLKGELNIGNLSFNTGAIDEVIDLPQPKGTLKEIFDILGIKNTLSVSIAPIQTTLTLPEGALKIDVKKRSENIFDVRASWSVSKLSAQTTNLALSIPKGMFDQAFTINSSPIEVGLKQNSNPIQFDLFLTTELTEAGTKIRLNSFKTNMIGPKQPDFYVTLGMLTQNQRPFTLSLMSNGKTLETSELAIREQLQQLEPAFINSIRNKISRIIEQKIKDASIRIESEPPFKYGTNTDVILSGLNLDPSLRKLLGGVDIDFLFSYIQSVKTSNLFSAQISSHICFDLQCLSNATPPSPVGTDDLRRVNGKDDVGVVVYESFLQNWIHSGAFQQRIKNYYYASGGSAGVDLAPSGVKFYLDPAKNAIVAVLNLEIDIKKTIKSGSKFGKRFKLWFGDVWELWFGTGKIVKIPIEIYLNLNDIIPDENGNPMLFINSTLPFTDNGSMNLPEHCPASECPSNIEKLTRLVKKGFFESVKGEIQSLVPRTIFIPLGKDVKVRDFTFLPKSVSVTTNHGLLVTAEMQTSTGEKNK